MEHSMNPIANRLLSAASEYPSATAYRTSLRSVSYSELFGLADRLSTQLFIIPLSEGKRIVEGLDGVEAVWVDKSVNVSYSSGFEQYKML